MSRNKSPRKRYRPRPVAVNTLALALSGCAKPAREDRERILSLLAASVRNLEGGAGSEHDWSVASGSLCLAQAIERQGVVRGLAEPLTEIEAALQAIYNRSQTNATLWLRPTLTAAEQASVRLLLKLHTFQFNNLSRSELEAAVHQAQKQIKADGHTSTGVRKDIEGVVA